MVFIKLKEDLIINLEQIASIDPLERTVVMSSGDDYYMHDTKEFKELMDAVDKHMR